MELASYSIKNKIKNILIENAKSVIFIHSLVFSEYKLEDINVNDFNDSISEKLSTVSGKIHCATIYKFDSLESIKNHLNKNQIIYVYSDDSNIPIIQTFDNGFILTLKIMEFNKKIKL